MESLVGSATSPATRSFTESALRRGLSDGRLDGYLLTFYTGDSRGAGTDAKVYVDLRGMEGATGKTILPNQTAKHFERGRADELTLRCPNLGELTELLVGQDGSGMIGNAWQLEKVVVRSKYNPNAPPVTFPCGKWIKREGGNKAERLLTRGSMAPHSPGGEGKPSTGYAVEVFTSNELGAATSSAVFVQLYGKKGTTGPLRMEADGNKFDRGAASTFMFPDAKRIGALFSCRIWHENASFRDAWKLDKIVLTDLKSGKQQTVPCYRWLSRRNDDGAIERTLFPEAAPRVGYVSGAVPRSPLGSGPHLTTANTF